MGKWVNTYRVKKLRNLVTYQLTKQRIKSSKYYRLQFTLIKPINEEELVVNNVP